MSRVRSHLSYANVVSTVCMFVLLGGTAYAAVTITGKSVKDGSLTGADVKDNSLTGGDVKNLGPGDFKGGALPTGPTGPQGPQGATGARGPAGAPDKDGPPGPGAKRIFVDNNAGVGGGTVYTTPDFTLSVDCSQLRAFVTRRPPANVAVSTMNTVDNASSDAPRQYFSFLNGNPSENVSIAGIGDKGTGSAEAIIQSYAPGTDTARNYTVSIALSSAWTGNCAAWGSVTPAD